MLMLIICWFLFFLPIYSAAMLVLGGWLYAQGISGKSPSIKIPNPLRFFSSSNGHNDPAAVPVNRGPDLV